MLKYIPSPYVTWIKHLSDYRSESDVLVEKDEGLEILVHPGHKRLSVPHADSLFGLIDKEDKTVQLYFYSLAWVIPVLIQGDEEKIAAALGLVENIVDIAPEEERAGAWNMLWDDHAVCERLCVIIELLSNDLSPLISNKDKLERHLEKAYQYIEKLVASDRWLNNNHRLFHFLASFVYHHHRGDSEKVDEFVDYISSFCYDLIDVETGFAREQCISYCFFDINIVGKVIKALTDLSVHVGFDIDKAHRNLLYHINAIAFPDGTLPASGDTPVGLKLTSYQKKFKVDSLEARGCWKRLDMLGYYRGKSPGEGTFEFLMLSHNAESGHGHYSPLHVDVWVEGVGLFLTDAGGPYKYGDKKRYSWFRAGCGHNSLSSEDTNQLNLSELEIKANSGRESLQGVAIFECSSHTRSLTSYSDRIVIDETVLSKGKKNIYYNFGRGVALESRDEKMIFSVKGREGVLVEIVSLFGDFNASHIQTPRCVGGAKVENADSLVLSLNEGLTRFQFIVSVFN